MFGRQQEARRAGIWVAGISAIAGLLFLQGSAHASSFYTAEELAELLETDKEWTVEERLVAAEALLFEDRARRYSTLASGVAKTGLSVWGHASVHRIYKGVRRIAGDVRDLLARSPAEDRALQLLESAMLDGAGSGRLEALYASLRTREERAGERRPLNLGLSEKALRANLPSALEHEEKLAPLRDWEADLVTALLLEDYSRVARVEVYGRDGELAHAVASYLAGDAEQALARFDGLARAKDGVALTAQRWFESSEFNLDRALVRAKRGYRVKRTLGWIGGDRLARFGADFSRVGYEAWSYSAGPTNVAVNLPLRIYHGWQADSDRLRSTAERYLQSMPEGERAGEARDWLIELGEAGEGPTGGWEDGHFVLPRAKTGYVPLTARPLVLTRRLLESGVVPELDFVCAQLVQGDAVMLSPARNGRPGSVAGERGLDLIANLARGIEQHEIRTHQRDRAEALGAIRRLESALRQGVALTVAAWSEDVPEQKLLALAARTEQTRGELRMARDFGRANFVCPRDMLCLDRQELLAGRLIGSFEVGDADLHIGASTSFQRAHFAVGFGLSGPHASLLLPVGHWLGIDRWLPLEARLGVSLAGVSVNPSLGDAVMR